MKNQASQKQLEIAYQKQQNFFYQTISEKLKYYAENQIKYLAILRTITKENISSEQFELLGCLTYLTGIDYTNQAYLQKIICENVQKRFEVFKFSKEFISVYVNSLENISEKNILDAKEQLKNTFIKDVFVDTKDKIKYLDMYSSIKQIINNSLVPVNLSYAVNQILIKKQFTYEDIIKLNSLINRQCKLLGNKAIKHMQKLYSNEVWLTTLNKALHLFDNQKLAIVYFDSILSVKESKIKFGNSLYGIITKDLDIDFDGIKINYDKKVAEKQSEENQNQSEKVPNVRLEDDVINNIGENNPVEFINAIFADVLGYYPDTNEDIIQAIEKILNTENDYASHIYHYLTANIEKIKDVSSFKLKAKEIFESLTKTLEDKKVAYKTVVEKLCKEIPDDYLNKIVNYTNAVINDLVLDTDEQKQYLTSQMLDNGITTFQHLQQILTLIESCDIIGSQLTSYVILHNYIEEKSEIVKIFKAGQGLDSSNLEISFYTNFAKYFEKIQQLQSI